MGPPEPYLSILEDNGRRGVAFLISSEKQINAYDVFKKLETDLKAYTELRTNMLNWLDGHDNLPQQFHKWDKSKGLGKLYPDCFVFKVGKNHRFYGYLCHPKAAEKRFLACVIVHHTKKNKKNTDERCLRVASEARQSIGGVAWPTRKEGN